jgi:hypothetical protein
MPVDPRPLSDDDIRSICSREIGAAESHVGLLSANRQRALDFYTGVNLWNSAKGQSSVVSREVLEVVEWTMPQLLKVFASSDEVVRFEPQGPEDVDAAEQATDYVNFLFTRQNAGFVNLHSWIKDALIGGLGILKIWWEDDPKIRMTDLTGLNEMQLSLLMQDQTLEIVAAEPHGEPMPGPDGQPMTLYDVRLKVTEPDGRVCIEPVPPEEYLFSPTVKTTADPGQGHRRRISQSDLIAQGYDPGIVDDLPTADDDDEWGERAHRYGPSTLESVPRDSRDRASRLVEIVEWYTKLDVDGDGLAEFRKFTLGGINQAVLLNNEEIDQPPFAALSPVLMPHRLDGLSLIDLVKDLQEIKTAITRQMLNSLYLANKPRTWAVDGQVNLQELLTSEAGGVVRVKAPGMIGELTTQFVAGQAFPMLEYVDKVLEGRSGVSKMSQGIDANILHGGGPTAASTATGIAALQSAAAARIELMARVIAETGVKHAFTLILALITKYQQRSKVIRLRNQWVEMDPRGWNTEFDMTTEVGLGTGNKMEQMQYLATILQGQKEALAMGGLGGLVTPVHLYHTYAKLIQLAGLKNVDQYFADPSQQPPQQQQPPPPDPNLLLVQVQAQVEQGKLELAREKMLREDDLNRDKLDADTALRSAELEMKYKTQVDTAHIQAMVDRDREALKQHSQLLQQQMQPPPAPNGAMQ